MAREYFEGKSVLVTGGLGFIGSNLALGLAELGARVTLMDSLIPEYGGSLFNIRDIRDRVQVSISDVRDPHAMRHLVRGQDVLFNLAGQTSHFDSMRDPETDLDINRIESELGWRPRVGLREGLARCLAFYRRHREHYWT